MRNKVFRECWRVACQSRKRNKTQEAEARRAASKKDRRSRRWEDKINGWSPQIEEDTN
jgi:hypothetical protein